MCNYSPIFFLTQYYRYKVVASPLDNLLVQWHLLEPRLSLDCSTQSSTSKICFWIQNSVKMQHLWDLINAAKHLVGFIKCFAAPNFDVSSTVKHSWNSYLWHVKRSKENGEATNRHLKTSRTTQMRSQWLVCKSWSPKHTTTLTNSDSLVP